VARVFLYHGGTVYAYADIMALLEILLGTGLVVGAVVAGLVYLDCVQRGLPAPTRLAWAFACGGGSFAGFLVPHVFSRELQHLYFQVLKPRPIAVTPREWLWVTLATGLVVGSVLVGLYLVGSRFWNWTQPEAH